MADWHCWRWGIWLLIPALRSATWPSAQGVITAHRIETLYLNKASNYHVGVEYAYSVNHSRHTGRVFSHASTPLPMTYRSREAAEIAMSLTRFLAQWKVGQMVTVFYDPSNPAESVLKTGAWSLPLAVCLLRAFLIGVAAWEGRKLRRQAATFEGASSARPG